jgi:hypothetical protein
MYLFGFPRTTFVDNNGILTQALHIHSEGKEVKELAATPDILHTAEKIMDCLHSCETGLRILKEKYGVDIDEVHTLVKEKNLRRGYYS